MYGWNVKTGGLCSHTLCIITTVLVLFLFNSQFQDMSLSNWMAPSKQSRKGVLDTESSTSQNESSISYENSRNTSWENSSNASTGFNLTVVEDCHQQKFEKIENIDEEFFFWWGGQPKLCNLIKEMKGGVSNLRNQGIQSMLNLSINCTNLIQNGGLGTGNWLIAFFMVRLVAAFSSVHLAFQCSAANMKSEILPFLQGCYPPMTDLYPAVFDQLLNVSNAEEILCSWDLKTAPVHLAALEIKKEMRRLVVETTGYERPILSVPVQTTWFGEIVFDEVAIHFRCGDVIHQKNPRGDYGFLRYSEYKSRIPNGVKTIGIITQSFQKSQNREQDQAHTEYCQDLVTRVAEKLQSDFNGSVVSIRNGPIETLILAYVRLAVADYSIIGLSSFSAFPLLANYGVNYFEEGRLQVNKWMNFIPMQMQNMTPMNGQFIRNRQIMKRGLNFTTDWILG